jgi:hypothetical protein
MPKEVKDTIFLVANGNLKHVTNRNGWNAQKDMEEKLAKVFNSEGIDVVRAHAFSEELGHGFIWNQRMGISGFRFPCRRRGWDLAIQPEHPFRIENT